MRFTMDTLSESRMFIHPGIIPIVIMATTRRGTHHIITTLFIRRGGHIAVTAGTTVAAVDGAGAKAVETDLPEMRNVVAETAMTM
jgi:hypothetical protein